MFKYLDNINNGTQNAVKLIRQYKYFILPYVVAIITYGIYEWAERSTSTNMDNNATEEPFIAPTTKDTLVFILEEFNKRNGLFKGINSIQLAGKIDSKSLITELDISVPLSFDLYEYRLPPDFIASNSFKKVNSLGKSIQNKEDERFWGLFEETINNSSINSGADGFDIKYLIDVNGLLTLKRIIDSKINGTKTTIYVKGFADGSHELGWSRPLEKTHFYDYIEYIPKSDRHPPVDFDYFYDDTMTATKINAKGDGRYRNDDLPNLRAKYIVEELIKPQIKIHGLDTDIKILEGKVIDRVKDKSNLRFVNIYIEFEW